MQVYVLDNMRGYDMCRKWDMMLPPSFEWVELSELESVQLVNDTGRIISPAAQDKSLLIIHRSSILNPDDQAWFRDEYKALVLIVHGDRNKTQEPFDDLPETDKVYYLKSALGLNDSGFRKRLKIFLNKYQERDDLQWELLEPPGTVTLAAIYILCQGYLSMHASVMEAQPSSGTLKRALDAMGWRDSGTVVNKHSDGDVLQMWNSVFGDVDVMVQAEIEWGDEDEGWGRVVPFLRNIGQVANDALTTLDADKVATAYCALAVRLGATPC